MLEQEGIAYVGARPRPRPRARGRAPPASSVVYGDAARRDALMAAGLARASARW
ncbi:MAG: hypothetical protein MZW92_09565 [Comamonadaceae bacterium]|nr:hypothetical protein [Comamonadaceae bacterium]